MFQLVERPALFPGRPLLQAVNGPFVDTGIEMELGGRVYIDPTSAAEIARLMPPPEMVQLRERLATSTAELESAQVELERLRPIVAAMREAAVA